MSTFPPRCFTCGKIVGNNLEKFLEEKKKGTQQDMILDNLRYSRMCCRRMFISYNPRIEEKLLFYNIKPTSRAESTPPLVKGGK